MIVIHSKETLDAFVEREGDGAPEWVEAFNSLASKVAARADYLLVYTNEDLGHPDVGEPRVCSYGSAASQLERTQFPIPPTTLPDTSSSINWRYQLSAVYAPGADETMSGWRDAIARDLGLKVHA